MVRKEGIFMNRLLSSNGNHTVRTAPSSLGALKLLDTFPPTEGIEIKSFLIKIQNRISAMSIVHESLFEKTNLEEINVPLN